MLKLHRRLLTQQEKIPFIWIILINITWFVALYVIFVNGVALPLTLRRFTDDTRLIGLLMSVGLIFGMVLGPLVNYLSDRLWTRFGRRRPFLLVASCGTLLGMVFIPLCPTLTPIILLVVVSSILGDVGSTQEPLWLEVIPPAQRGAGVAVRIIATNLASLAFFQAMFAQFDNVYVLPAGPWGTGLTVNGEQLCYFAGALLVVLQIVLYGALVKEVYPEGVTLKPWRELDFSPVPFFRRFVREVFGERRWWWIYLFYASTSFVTYAWGGFNNLMLVEQFRYDKPSIALTGLPPMILVNVLLNPFMGWYSDRLPRLPLVLLAAVALAGGAGLFWLTGRWTDLPIYDLPPLWGMFLMCTLGTIAGAALVLFLFQGFCRLTPHRNPRLWAWYLGMVNTVVVAAATYALVKLGSPGGIPSMTLWFLVMCLNNGTGCLNVVAGPLLYEYIPKDKLGTLSSGFGMISTALNACVQNLAGIWIFYFSLWFATGGAKDYTSGYLLQILLGLVSLACMTVFLVRALRGKIIEYGRLGLTSDQA